MILCPHSASPTTIVASLASRPVYLAVKLKCKYSDAHALGGSKKSPVGTDELGQRRHEGDAKLKGIAMYVQDMIEREISEVIVLDAQLFTTRCVTNSYSPEYIASAARQAAWHQNREAYAGSGAYEKRKQISSKIAEV